MIEKTVFSDEEIVAQIKSNYNIITNDIEHEDRGSANIFYITDDENKRYVFKEFESGCKEEKILKEAQIVYFLKSKNISVPEYVKTVDNKYYFKYKNRIVILMKYITGYTKNPNTGSYEQVIECANLHGRVLKALENYEKLEQSDIEKWHMKKQIEPARAKYNKLIKKLGNSEIDKKIEKDIKYKLELLDKIEQIDFDGMQYMTFKNCNGDFSIMQFIYENEKIKAVLDFERAKYMPVGWEIIRSYTHIDEQCKDGSFNIKNYNDYMKTVMKYVKLNEYDLKFTPYMYLLRLATSPYGFEEYINNHELTDLLNFGFWRTKMCQSIYKIWGTDPK